jgi:hypothetical protein
MFLQDVCHGNICAAQLFDIILVDSQSHLVTYAYARTPAFDPAAAFASQQFGGIFAPTIRYHAGTYYMITTNEETFKQ